MTTGNIKGKNDNVGVGTVQLWAIGVGAFIGGDFVGWPSVLSGGFGSGIVSVMFMGFYFWMIGKVAGDLSARFREPGGTYMFCRRIFGRRLSPFIAIMQSLKLMLSNCCMALAISSYIQQITFKSNILQIILWFSCYMFCTVLDVVGIKVSAHGQIVVVFICLSIIFIFFVSSTMLFDFEVNAIGDRGWFHDGLNGFLVSLPFGMWFLDGFEELPLAISYTNDHSRTVPLAMSFSWLTAVTLAMGLMLCGSAAIPYETLLSAPAPLMPILKLVWGDNGAVTALLDGGIILGLIVSFSSFVFFSGQTVQAIAIDKVLPEFLSLTHKKFDTAANASIFASSIGFLATLSFGLIFGEDRAQRVLIVCSLLAGIICYFFVFSCLATVLKTEASWDGHSIPLDLVGNRPSQTFNSEDVHEERISSTYETCGHDPGPMAFPLGRAGAVFGQIITILLFLCTISLAFKHKDYEAGVIIIVCICLIVVAGTGLMAFLSGPGKVLSTSTSLSLDISTSSSILDQSVSSTTPLQCCPPATTVTPSHDTKSQTTAYMSSKSSSTSALASRGISTLPKEIVTNDSGSSSSTLTGGTTVAQKVRTRNDFRLLHSATEYESVVYYWMY